MKTELERSPSGEHLRGLTREVRRASGVVYTPDSVVDFVLDQALRDRSDLLDSTVLDPACGAGAFLTALLRRLASRLSAQGVDLATAGGHDALVSTAQERLRGLDVDEAAVILARDALRAETQGISPGPLPNDYMHDAVRVGDFLSTGWGSDAGTPALIVGNPPYVPIDRLPPSLKSRLQAVYVTATGRLDMYTVFMEQAAQTVGPAGRWAFITPDKYLASQSARPLRALLSEVGSVRSVARFDSHKVFSDAATVPCVTVWDRQKNDRPVEMLRCTSVSGSPVLTTSVEHLARTRFRGAIWDTSTRHQLALSNRISGNHPTLEEVCSRISAGVATGFNPAFVLDESDAAQVEREVIHRTAGGRDVQANCIADSGRRLLVPHRWDSAGDASLIDLDEYPRAKLWLSRHRDALERRHCVRAWGKAWWDLHDVVSPTSHLGAKIVVPDLARTNRFAADLAGDIVPQHSLYYALPMPGLDPSVLAALLNSTAVQYLMLSNAPVAKDGFRRYRRQFLVNLPVPELNQQQSEQIRLLLEQNDRDALNTAVNAAYGIEPLEVEFAMTTELAS